MAKNPFEPPIIRFWESLNVAWDPVWHVKDPLLQLNPGPPVGTAIRHEIPCSRDPHRILFNSIFGTPTLSGPCLASLVPPGGKALSAYDRKKVALFSIYIG